MYLHLSNGTDCQALGWLPVATPSPPPAPGPRVLPAAVTCSAGGCSRETWNKRPTIASGPWAVFQQQPYVRCVKWKTLSGMVFHHANWFLTLSRFSHLPMQPAHTLAHNCTILRHGPKRSGEPRPDALDMLRGARAVYQQEGPAWLLKLLQFRHLNWKLRGSRFSL